MTGMKNVGASSNSPGGFTLIELLIVVAVIAILAAIAVPNFLEAQARSKVAREMSDLRSLATALESYAVDNNRYPPHGEILEDDTVIYPAFRAGFTTLEFSPPVLTTPIAYLSSLPRDPMLKNEPQFERRAYGYVNSALMASILILKGIRSVDDFTPAYGGWRLYAAGPDGDRGRDTKSSIPYDPTNGTISNGDIIRSQNKPSELRNRDE